MTQWQEKFEALGVNVAAMTYDEVAPLTDFAEEREIAYPLLSDHGAKHVDALGIRNESYAEDHFAHGVPHPGVFYIGADGSIALKRAVPGYRDRPPFDELFAAVSALAAPESGEQMEQTEQPEQTEEPGAAH